MFLPFSVRQPMIAGGFADGVDDDAGKLKMKSSLSFNLD